MPVDLVEVFQQAGVPFYEACLLVEIHDHRKPASAAVADGGDPDDGSAGLFYLREGGRYGTGRDAGPCRVAAMGEDMHPGPDGVEVYRIILRPTAECLWNDLKEMDAKHGGLWSDSDALKVEAAIVVRVPENRRRSHPRTSRRRRCACRRTPMRCASPT